MTRDTRPISWITAARKDFEEFPEGAQLEFGRALTIVAEGRHPDIAKPMKGFGPAFSSWSCAFVAMHTASFTARR